MKTKNLLRSWKQSRSSSNGFVGLCLGALCMSGVMYTPVSEAGLIIASGDNTPAYYAGDTSYDNGVFFSNILGSGSSVFVHEAYSLDIGNNLSNYYNGLGGVSSTYSDLSEITAGSLSGVDLLVTGLRGGVLSSSEINVIGDYLNAGGSIMFMGDYSYDYNGINSALTGIGSGMSLYAPNIDIGSNLAGVAEDPLTAGVTHFNYGATWGVTGGTGLFFDSQQRYIMAYENYTTVVPVPSALALFGSGLIGLAFARKRKA